MTIQTKHKIIQRLANGDNLRGLALIMRLKIGLKLLNNKFFVLMAAEIF